ncbi:MAG: hypothetical protein RL489_3323 [Pseudomonadota bacterium]|jgi:type I restriction enzyme M protein
MPRPKKTASADCWPNASCGASSACRAADKAARAAAIDAAAFDLKAVNPNMRTTQDNRTPAEILDTIERHGQAVGEALARLRGLMDASSMAG